MIYIIQFLLYMFMFFIIYIGLYSTLVVTNSIKDYIKYIIYLEEENKYLRGIR